MRIIFGLVFFLMAAMSWAQAGEINGKVFDVSTNEPLSFATVTLQNTSYGALTDENGDFVIKGVKPGLYNLQCSFVGFASFVMYEVEVSVSRAVNVQIGLQPSQYGITLEIKAKGYVNQDESPISVRGIGANEIKRNPGGSRDISKAIRSLPGVASIPSFRNDIIIRGGASSENRF